MRRLASSLALTCTLLLGSGTSFGQVADAGEPSAPTTADEGLPMRIGKAVVFGVVATALLVFGGGRWQRARRRRKER